MRRLRIISAWAQERVARQRHVDFEHRWRKNVMEDLVEERNRCATLVEAVREEREYRLKAVEEERRFQQKIMNELGEERERRLRLQAELEELRAEERRLRQKIMEFQNMRIPENEANETNNNGNVTQNEGSEATPPSTPPPAKKARLLEGSRVDAGSACSLAGSPRAEDFEDEDKFEVV